VLSKATALDVAKLAGVASATRPRRIQLPAVREKVLERQRLCPPPWAEHTAAYGDLSWRAIRHVSRLSVDERRDLLRDLTAPSIIRADAIRQFRERPDGQGMAEVMMDLEADEPLRLQVVDALRRSLASPGGRQEQ